jgi:hypothetical protein
VIAIEINQIGSNQINQIYQIGSTCTKLPAAVNLETIPRGVLEKLVEIGAQC